MEAITYTENLGWIVILKKNEHAIVCITDASVGIAAIKHGVNQYNLIDYYRDERLWHDVRITRNMK